jgi:hypothetical protein
MNEMNIRDSDDVVTAISADELLPFTLRSPVSTNILRETDKVKVRPPAYVVISDEAIDRQDSSPKRKRTWTRFGICCVHRRR